MPTIEGVEKHYCECACSSTDHTIKLCLFGANKDDEPELYMEVQLPQRRSWYQRVWVAVKYIFGYQCRYGHWDTFSFDVESAKEMKDVLKNYLRQTKDFEASRYHDPKDCLGDS